MIATLAVFSVVATHAAPTPTRTLSSTELSTLSASSEPAVLNHGAPARLLREEARHLAVSSDGLLHSPAGRGDSIQRKSRPQPPGLAGPYPEVKNVDAYQVWQDEVTGDETNSLADKTDARDAGRPSSVRSAALEECPCLEARGQRSILDYFAEASRMSPQWITFVGEDVAVPSLGEESARLVKQGCPPCLSRRTFTSNDCYRLEAACVFLVGVFWYVITWANTCGERTELADYVIAVMEGYDELGMVLSGFPPEKMRVKRLTKGVAQSLGVHVSDLLIEINGKSVKDMEKNETQLALDQRPVKLGFIRVKEAKPDIGECRSEKINKVVKKILAPLCR